MYRIFIRRMTEIIGLGRMQTMENKGTIITNIFGTFLISEDFTMYNVVNR